MTNSSLPKAAYTIEDIFNTQVTQDPKRSAFMVLSLLKDEAKNLATHILNQQSMDGGPSYVTKQDDSSTKKQPVDTTYHISFTNSGLKIQASDNSPHALTLTPLPNGDIKVSQYSTQEEKAVKDLGTYDTSNTGALRSAIATYMQDTTPAYLGHILAERFKLFFEQSQDVQGPGPIVILGNEEPDPIIIRGEAKQAPAIQGAAIQDSVIAQFTKNLSASEGHKQTMVLHTLNGEACSLAGEIENHINTVEDYSDIQLGQTPYKGDLHAFRFYAVDDALHITKQQITKDASVNKGQPVNKDDLEFGELVLQPDDQGGIEVAIHTKEQGRFDIEVIDTYKAEQVQELRTQIAKYMMNSLPAYLAYSMRPAANDVSISDNQSPQIVTPILRTIEVAQLEDITPNDKFIHGSAAAIAPDHIEKPAINDPDAEVKTTATSFKPK